MELFGGTEARWRVGGVGVVGEGVRPQVEDLGGGRV